MDLTNLSLFAHDLAAFDVPLPEPAQQALALSAAAHEAVNAHPADDLRAAFAAGELTADTIGERLLDAARTLTAKQAAASLITDLNLPLGKAASAALAADGDRIVKALRPAFNKAAEAMGKAAVSFDPDSTADDVLRTGPDAAGIWHSLAEHAVTLERIHSIRTALARTGYGPSQHTIALYAERLDNDEQAASASRALTDSRGPGGRWHRLAQVATLKLNTAAEAAAVLAHLEQQRAAAAEHQRAAQTRAAQQRADGWTYATPTGTADGRPKRKAPAA